MSTVYQFDSSTQPIQAGACALIQVPETAAPLGTYASSITPHPAVKHSARGRDVIATNRAERYRLLSVARSLLVAAGRRAGIEYPHNYHRTAKCKFIQRGSDYVSVYIAPEHGAAFYTGLVTCGSVWTCPICAAKVQERRRDEISKAIDWCYDSGYQPVMVTLTFPHQSWQKLGGLLEQQAKALQRLRAGQPWDRFKKLIDFQGLIRALELTHGASGWHPHTHELWFVKKDADAEDMRKEITKRWESACIRAGLLSPNNVTDFRKYAVNVKGNCSNSDYLAKQDDSKNWGVDREIAKASTKAGKEKGRHPFGLLARAADGDRRSGRLFLIYSIAMKGRRQLFWSVGLKDRIGLHDKSDEILAEESTEAADLLGMLSPEDWRAVRTAEARAQVLRVAEQGGWKAVQKLLASLCEPDGGCEGASVRPFLLLQP